RKQPTRDETSVPVCDAAKRGTIGAGPRIRSRSSCEYARRRAPPAFVPAASSRPAQRGSSKYERLTLLREWIWLPSRIGAIAANGSGYGAVQLVSKRSYPAPWTPAFCSRSAGSRAEMSQSRPICTRFVFTIWATAGPGPLFDVQSWHLPLRRLPLASLFAVRLSAPLSG